MSSTIEEFLYSKLRKLVSLDLIDLTCEHMTFCFKV